MCSCVACNLLCDVVWFACCVWCGVCVFGRVCVLFVIYCVMMYDVLLCVCVVVVFVSFVCDALCGVVWCWCCVCVRFVSVRSVRSMCFFVCESLCGCVWCVFIFDVRFCACACVDADKKVLRVLCLICCAMLYGLALLFCLCASVLLVKTSVCLC